MCIGEFFTLQIVLGCSMSAIETPCSLPRAAAFETLGTIG